LLQACQFREWIDTRKLFWREKIIDVVESKSITYDKEEFRKVRANKRRERDLHVHINEMHIHMRETESKKEELKQYEKALKTGGIIEDTGGTIGET
jgi:tRNA(Glu) U13 pseudouridine synthase TruD